MARPDHVPTPESGEQVSPTQSTGTESEGVEEDQNFTKRENGQWRSQDIRLDIIHRLQSSNHFAPKVKIIEICENR